MFFPYRDDNPRRHGPPVATLAIIGVCTAVYLLVQLPLGPHDGQAYVLGFGFARGSTPTPIGVTLEIATPAFVLTTGTHAGTSSPTSIPVPVPNSPALSGLSVYLQLVTDDTNGATGQWLGSLLETVTIQ